MNDPNCIFCKIAAGVIPCHKIFEDERLLAFLDVGPLSRGHTLIIPKDHYRTIDELPEELAGACGAIVPRLSRALVAATGCARVERVAEQREDRGASGGSFAFSFDSAAGGGWAGV